MYFNEKKPRVPKVLRVSWHTASITGRYVPVTGAGAVYTGAGAVWENPTRGLPVLNPIHGASTTDIVTYGNLGLVPHTN